MVAELQGRAQLESQVLHDHVALQEQKSVPIDLLEDAARDVWFCRGGLAKEVDQSANLRVFEKCLRGGQEPGGPHLG